MLNHVHCRRTPARFAASDSALVESLEPRCMLAGTPFVFDTADGDRLTVTVDGPGAVDTASTTTTTTGLGVLVLSGTTSASTLSIAVRKGPTGNGVVTLDSLAGATLKSINAAAVDITGAISITGAAGSFTFRDISGSLTINAPALAIKVAAADVSGSLTLDASVTLNAARFTQESSLVVTTLSGLTLKPIAARAITADFAGTLTVTAAGPASAIKIPGTVRGAAWSFDGGVKSLAIGGVLTGAGAPDWTVQIAGALGAFSSGSNFDADLSAFTVGTFSVTTSATGSLTVSQSTAAGVAIASIKGGRISDFVLSAPVGAITTGTCVEWLGGSLTARSVGKLSTTGAPATVQTPASNGNLSINVALTGNGPALTLGSVTVKGFVDDCVMTIAGNAGAFTAGGVRDSALYVGAGQAALQLPSSTPFSAGTGAIASITIKGPYNPSSPVLARSFLVARTIGKFSVAGATDFDNNGTTFGVATTLITNVSVLDDTGTRVSASRVDVTNYNNEADLGDFVARFFA